MAYRQSYTLSPSPGTPAVHIDSTNIDQLQYGRKLSRYANDLTPLPNA